MSASTHPQVSRRSVLAGMGGAVAFGGVASSGLLAPPASATAPPARDHRVEALLRRMTLAEKLGQLQLVGTPDAAAPFLALRPGPPPGGWPGLAWCC